MKTTCSKLGIQINAVIPNVYLQVITKSGTYHVQKLSQKDSCSDRYMVITTRDHFNQTLQKVKKILQHLMYNILLELLQEKSSKHHLVKLKATSYL